MIISLDMLKNKKRYSFYYLSHITRTEELRNAKFLENDLISKSNHFQDIIFEKNHYDAPPSRSSDRLVVIHTPQFQAGVRRSVIEVP